MWYRLYNLALYLALPVIVWLLLTKKRCQRGVWTRLGAVPQALQVLRPPIIWIHAASLGEVTAIVPLLRQIKVTHPQCSLVVSTVTETGHEVVAKQLEGVALHCYAPIDFWCVVQRYVRTLRPRLFILVESELWPNLLKSLHRHHVPVCLVNGRLSSRSYARYGWIQGFMGQVLSHVNLALMQTPVDAERIRALGANPASVHVTGNMKFDQTMDQSDPRYADDGLRATFGLGVEDVVLVAGSTHPKEEECLLEAYRNLLQSHPEVVLIMAPRHVERASTLEAVIQQYGMACIRRSQLAKRPRKRGPGDGGEVILLDSRGELPFVYQLGFVGFVGGTLVPVGGHNLLEPAQWGRPVMFGPYIDHCRDIARLLLEEGGAIQVKNQDDLLSHMIHLVEHPLEANQIGKRALAAVTRHRGVTAKNLQWIDQLLGAPPFSTVSHALNPGAAVEVKTFRPEGFHL
ncbi:MAG: 3-deoxy-D-manno-octulosonic acid transferase [Nitrospirota bacterium]|nr:3-deoxy-D-manno-octulosonic acid transferase [Nitrospirota bacterium]